MTDRPSSSAKPACYDLPLELAQGSGCPTCLFIRGAAVAFGLMGMAEAIRANPRVQGVWCDWCEKSIDCDKGFALWRGLTFCNDDCMTLFGRHGP